MPKFEKLRVSLVRSDQPPLLTETGHDDAHLSRSEFLRRSFAERRTFLKDQIKFSFHPLDAPNGYAAGFFAREQSISLRHENLVPYTAENFEPVLAIISLDKDQIVWMEDRQNVGSGKSILESFFVFISKKTALKDWEVFVRYFENKIDYWEAVERYKLDITKVIFRFVPPNAFEGKAWAQKFYTAIQQEAGNDVLEETFKGKPGKMKLDGPLMAASAEIAEEGAGERELRGLRNRVLYSSNEQGRVTASVPEEDMPTVESPAFLRRIIDRLFK